MNSVDHLTAKQWSKILSGAEEFKEAYHSQLLMDNVVSQLRRPSGRANCIEEDSD
jgi:hypothetical protein